jgi:O-antigen/teichoic acid export membrane protein
VFFILGPTALLSLTLNLLLIPKFDMWGAACVNLFSETVILCGCFWLTRRKLRQAETAAT